MQIAKSWKEVKLWQYQELCRSREIEGEFQKAIEQISILAETTSDDPMFDDLSVDELFGLIEMVKFLRVPPKGNIKEVEDMQCKSMNSLTLGEFIDLEHYFQDPINNLHLICAILFRRKREDDWGNTQLEPYSYSIQERSEIFLDAPLESIYGIVESYYSFRNTFMDNYSPLFENPDNYEIDNENELDPEEIEELKREIEEDKKKAKWSWESMIYNLSNGDITKFDAIFNTSLVLVFNTLSMKKTLGI